MPELYLAGDRFSDSAFHNRSVNGGRQNWWEYLLHQISERPERVLVWVPSTQFSTQEERVIVWVGSTPDLYPAGDRFGTSAFHTNFLPGRRQFFVWGCSTTVLYPVGDKFGSTAIHVKSVPGWRLIWWEFLPHTFCTRQETVLVVLHTTPILYPGGDIFGRVRSTPILYPVGDRFAGIVFHTNSVLGQREIWWECVPHQFCTRSETD